MKTEKTFQPQKNRHYEAPLTLVTGCSIEGVLCMSSNVTTEMYDVQEEFEW